MKRILYLFAGAAVFASASHGAVYTYDFGTVQMSGNANTNVGFSMNITEPVRGYYMTGDWVNLSGTHQSTQFRTNFTPVGAAVTGDIRHGGFTNTDPFSYIALGSFWDNARGASNGPGIGNVVPGGTTAGHDRLSFNMDMNGSMNMAFRSIGTTGSSEISNAVGHFLTDAVAPMTGSFGPNSPTFQRPTFLDAVHASGSVFQYATTGFSLGAAGTYLVGAHTLRADTGANFDGMVLLYSGAFNAADPLNNLVGLDDLGNFIQTPSMLLNLEAGNYTMVYTHWSATAPTFDVNFTGYVAGVPEPGTMAALALGVSVFIRRRRKSTK